jgi:hypothetical protein
MFMRAPKLTGHVANRFIIDTLNDSLIDLPEEGQEMLDRCLRHESNLHDEKPRRKFWKKT